MILLSRLQILHEILQLQIFSCTAINGTRTRFNNTRTSAEKKCFALKDMNSRSFLIDNTKKDCERNYLLLADFELSTVL